nr:GIY-YIG nuclease family protein [uncultured Draconibacterium sp.]
MQNGYVYILTNSSMPDLIKIGKTARDSRTRAKELSTTSIPTPFKVAFEIFSSDYENIERKAHASLEDFRVNQNREFFRYPLNEAIELLQRLNNSISKKSENYQAVDIMDGLKVKYPDHLRDDIVAVRIVQPENLVWLEITFEDKLDSGRLINQKIIREDLAYIINSQNEERLEDYKLFFDPNDSVQTNAIKYLEEFDAESIIMTSDLFKEEYKEKYYE